MHNVECAAVGFVALTLAACGGAVLETRNLSTLPQNGFDGAYMSYFLPSGVVKFTLSYEPPDKEKKMKGAFAFATDGKVVAVPDTSQHYHAVYRHAGLSNDSVLIETTPDGMLKTVSTTTKDESVEVLKQIGEVVKQAIELRSTLEAQRDAEPTVRTELTGQPEKKPKCPKFVKEFLVDVTTGRVLVPRADKEPLAVPKNGRSEDIIGLPNCNAFISARLTSISDRNKLDAQVFPTELSASERQTCSPNGSQGLCFRIQGGFSMSVKAELFDGVEPSTVTRFIQGIAPVEAPVGAIHFNRRSFVENTTTVEFTNGALTKIQLKDPSELRGFLSLPLEALKFVTILVKV